MQFPTFVLALATLSTTFAKPLALSPRDSVSPPITNPTAGTVWKAGSTQTITWDVAALHGAQPSNPLAKLILGTVTPDGEENLMFESPLLSGFPILDGNVSLTLPWLPSGDNYILCGRSQLRLYTGTACKTLPPLILVFGSTLDISHPFTIVGTEA
ncbi:hypothetical protein C8Q78DRAFT_1042331 [Trametes maxima]|nr:hypothetical protein C8Q78DRAFT_1042331 [Trametes maxima]